MRFERASVVLVVGSLFAIGCGSDTTAPEVLQLPSPRQRRRPLMDRITQLAPVHNDET
jgi:hypothetical protein